MSETKKNCISGVLFSMFVSSAVESSQKTYKIGICCFSPKYAALRSKSKNRLALNQNNVSRWSDMSTLGLSFR